MKELLLHIFGVRDVVNDVKLKYLQELKEGVERDNTILLILPIMNNDISRLEIRSIDQINQVFKRIVHLIIGYDQRLGDKGRALYNTTEIDASRIIIDELVMNSSRIFIVAPDRSIISKQEFYESLNRLIERFLDSWVESNRVYLMTAEF